MPFDRHRLAELRKAKGLERGDLATLANVSQSQVTKHENGDAESVEMIEKFADVLDCTLDYFYQRGPVYRDANDAAIQMSYDVFAREKTCTDNQREWCKRVLLHHATPPKTLAAWKILAQQIEIAIGPTQDGRNLRAV